MPEEQSDESLVLLCQAESGQFFGQLYDRYFEKIYGFIYYRTRHKQTAEDIASKVFYRVLENLYKFNPNKGKFSTWIYQIARNSIIDYFRTNRNFEDIENVWDLSSSENIERSTDASLAMEKLALRLKDLDRQQREIVIMRLWDGLSYKEIAEILNLGESNCKMIFSRTVAKLQKEMILVLLLFFMSFRNF